MTQLPPPARNVQEALAAAGSASDVVVLPDSARTAAEAALAAYEQIWAAGGTPHAILATTYPELVRMTQGAPVEVS
jgi:hypothetical protein